MKTVIQHAKDFAITGRGDNPAWAGTEWLNLAPVMGPMTDTTRAKLLYTYRGIYGLFDCVDSKLSCTITEEGGKLYEEDVVEIFLQPDESQRVYIEYELSPLNKDLVLLVPNDGQQFYGWTTFKMPEERLPRHEVTVRGGKREPGAQMQGFTAEFFIPFSLFAGLSNTPPSKGTQWRGNLYRIDYDDDPRTLWAWCRDTGRSFHDFKHFGWIEFG